MLDIPGKIVYSGKQFFSNKETVKMKIFDKCDNLSNVKAAKEWGLYPYFHTLNTRQDTEVVMEGREMLMLGSNNYLGLTSDPRVTEAA